MDRKCNSDMVGISQSRHSRSCCRVPLGVGCGDVALNQATTAMLDDNEYVEQPKRGGHDDQEITGNDSLGVQA